MDRFQQLIKALESYGTTELIDYWASYHSSDIKSDLIRLQKEGAPVDHTYNDLKAFTMAAMQGILANPTIDLNTFSEDRVAACASTMASATLTELSKHQ